MTSELQGKTIAILAADGVEQVELISSPSVRTDRPLGRAGVLLGGATRMELYAIARPVMFFMGCDGPLCSNLVRQRIDMGDLVPVGDAAVRGAGLRSRFPLAGRGVGSLP